MNKAKRLLAALQQHGYTVSTAESCTGGNIAHRITLVAGSSASFMGGVVSYSNEVKSRVLGVHPLVLAENGAVSRPVVEAMAEGVARVCDTDCSMATSGIAGPGGAVPGKPVGTVWIAVHTPCGTVSRLHHYDGDRPSVIEQATDTAMDMLLEACEACGVKK